MNKNVLAYMESFYMALADKTRLRILNLIRDEEVCVYFFTAVLGESQPKISRHLAYMRGSGLVNARRDGKWIHYSIAGPDSNEGRRVLNDILGWMDTVTDLREERQRYSQLCETTVPVADGLADNLVDIAPADASEYEYARSAHNELDEFLL